MIIRAELHFPDFRLYLYDMTAPRLKLPRRQSNSYCSHQTTMEVVNEINGEPGRWTITDSHLSPDNERHDLRYLLSQRRLSQYTF
jgi:hypothetical protein